MEITNGSVEAKAAASSATEKPAGGAEAGVPRGNSALARFTTDLTAQAAEGKIDPVVGRDMEIRQIIDILSRRRQNNPILTGEAGVGKTAVVEGFALKIVEGDVPPNLKNVTLRTLDLALLQAGAGVRGEFENRLKGVIEEVKSSPQPIILFIDEAHNMIGAGGQAGQGDAANLLKPALARGELRTIAATTWAEYKKFFEEDAALTRRFQVVKVEEPSEAQAIQMIRRLAGKLEDQHKIRIRNEAVVESVRLSNRYISGRQLPDKAVSVIDTACARISLSQTATPPQVEDLRKRLESLVVEAEALKRESLGSFDHSARLGEIEKQHGELERELEVITKRWEQENELVRRISAAYTAFKELPADQTGEAQRSDLERQITEMELELATLQQHSPLVHACCDKEAIAETISAWTGIPLGRMVKDEIRNILDLERLLQQSVVGQDHAIKMIAETLRLSRANLADPEKPIGVFMLAGTSGVGKTETALSLANLLFGSDQNLTTINMSEIKQSHQISSLTGPPPGYVGYGKGGLLTEALRQRPYSVVLLDEFEKAHPDVQDFFYQVFDKGQLTDGVGRVVSFRNSLILMTTNAGTDLVSTLCADHACLPDPKTITEALQENLIKQNIFKPAFLGRVTLVPYYPLSDEVIRLITGLKLNKVRRRLESAYQAKVIIGEDVAPEIASRCKEVETGARNVDKIINQNLLPGLSAEVLRRMAEGLPIREVKILLTPERQFNFELQ
jgi:type VI secretion system protein VasG